MCIDTKTVVPVKALQPKLSYTYTHRHLSFSAIYPQNRYSIMLVKFL